MIRASALLAVLFAAGCSSASSAPDDAGADVVVAMKARDAGQDAKKDSAPLVHHEDAGTVCAPAPPAPAAEAGKEDAEPGATHDAAKDTMDAGKPDADAGPIHCTHDSECTAGDICDTNKGVCIANAESDAGPQLCGSNTDGGGVPGACAVNPDDMCCAGRSGCVANPAKVDAGPLPEAPIPLPPTDPCCPGAAGDTYCQGKLSDDSATCTGNVCTTCLDTCVRGHLAAYQKFLGYQLTDCGCTANGGCYDACHEATTAAPGTPCGMCLAAQTAEDLSSTCTLTAAEDCSNDPSCTAFQACAGACPM